jgi:type IX secretion system PorP/SprF family membrane protein
MNKNVFNLIVFVFVVGITFSQQLYHFNQYLFNEMILNPAATGSNPCNTLIFDFRKQWLDMEGSPQTQNISFGGVLKKESALGGTIYNDIAGSFRLSGVELDYSYHFFRDKRQFLSIGLGPSLTQYVFDGSGFKTEIINDPAFKSGFNELIFDLATGLYYKNNYFLVSVGAKNLFETRIKNVSSNRLVRNYYLTSSYNVILGTNTRVEPSIFIRSIGKLKPQIDYSLKFIFYQNYWVGLTARLNDAIVPFFGFELQNFSIGYGFEYTVSDLSDFNHGSHEFVLRYKFCQTSDQSNHHNQSLNKKRHSKSLSCPVW